MTADSDMKLRICFSVSIAAECRKQWDKMSSLRFVFVGLSLRCFLWFNFSRFGRLFALKYIVYWYCHQHPNIRIAQNS